MFVPHRDQSIAVCLASVAGFVDAIGFLWLGGFFISFMTGNSTRLGTELGSPDWSKAGTPLAIIGLFVVGVMLGTILRRVVRVGRPAVMALVTALLLFSSLLATTGYTILATTAATLAMGAENCVFEHDGEVTVGLTYMTGTLVKMSQHATAALLGGPRLGWLPHFLRWVGLLCGAIAGSFVYGQIGLQALWVPTMMAAALTGVMALQRVD